MREQWPRIEPAFTLGIHEAGDLIRPWSPNLRIAAVSNLVGGLSNTNVRVDFEAGRAPVTIRIYQRRPESAAKERAIYALGTKLRLPMPNLLFSADNNPVSGSPYAIMEWVEGGRLDQVAPRLETRNLIGAASSVGRALAAIHRVTFDRSGDFDDSLKIQNPMDVGSQGLLGFARECIGQGLAAERLGGELTERLLKFIEGEGGILDEWEHPPCLTHSDFGGTNILMRLNRAGYSVAAVLDWEFAFSGNPFFDFGNLLRPPLGALAGFSESVAAGYREAGGDLPVQWRDMAAIADLSAWLEFLSRPQASSAIIASAKQQIVQTISR